MIVFIGLIIWVLLMVYAPDSYEKLKAFVLEIWEAIHTCIVSILDILMDNKR